MGTTTTSSLTTSSVCFYPVTNVALAACTATGRKKRAVVKDPLSQDEMEVLPSAASNAKINIDSGVEAAPSNRQARFFLYYMTTTSTSTSTSTSYTGTYSVSLISCTPTTVGSYCGR